MVLGLAGLAALAGLLGLLGLLGLAADTYRNTRSALHRQGSIAGQSHTAFSKCFVRFGEMSDLGPLKGLPGPF